MTSRAPTAPAPQIFSTCRKSTSTGVDRPKIPTMTRSLPFSVFTSSMLPVKESKGPSMIRTISPTEKLCRGFRIRSALISPAFCRMPRASSCEMGCGFWFLLEPDEAGDAGDLADLLADLFPPGSGQVHLHHDVAGEELLGGHPLVPVLDLDDFLRRDLHVEDVVLQRALVHEHAHVLLHLVLIPRVGMQDVPRL